MEGRETVEWLVPRDHACNEIEKNLTEKKQVQLSWGGGRPGTEEEAICI